jgi:hypothetical protein
MHIYLVSQILRAKSIVEYNFEDGKEGDNAKRIWDRED